MVAGLHKKFFQKIPFEIEEFILLAIIILNIFDGIELLPATLDYVKKIISWSALGLLLHKIKISKLLTGTNRPKLDGFLIGGYFLLIIKNLAAHAMSSLGKTSEFLQPFFMFLVKYATPIETIGILVGSGLLVVVALHYTLRAKVKKPSVLSVLQEKEGGVSSTQEGMRRFVKSLFVIVMFFIVIFNLVMEWLAIAIDAPLVMIGLAVYIFFIVRHKKRFLPQSFLAKFGDFGSSFYEDVIKHFKYKKTILRAISGLLVLHLLTDALSFMWPFIFGIADPLYFNLLSSTHLSAITLFKADIMQLSLLKSVAVGIMYLINVIGLLLLLLLPAVLWLALYKNKSLHLKEKFIGVVYGIFIVMLLAPAFLIRPILKESIAGVDIIGQSVLKQSLLNPLVILLLGVVVTLVVFFLAQHNPFKKNLTKAIIIFVQLFFSAYIIMYFMSIASYFLRTIQYLSSANNISLSIIMTIFFCCSAIFYVLGLYGFLMDTHKHAQKHLQYKTLRREKHSH